MEIPEFNSWPSTLKKELAKDYFLECISKVENELSRGIPVYPSSDNIFRAFELLSFDAVKVLILGQDPYFNKHQANGLAFSVSENIDLPPSLKNIYKELNADLGIDRGINGSLDTWAKQGVLLLNSVLTVQEGKPGSHRKFGWEIFTDAVIKILSDHKPNMVFILWGNYARSKKVLIDTQKHLIIESPHPSPLSAYQGFWDSKPFSKTNSFLKNKNLTPIHW